MAQHVDKIEISVTGLPAKIHVRQFDLAIAVNDIPRVTLEILPIEAKEGQTDASAPTFSEITELYHKLFSKSLDLRQTATVTIRLDSKEGECSKQKIELKNWILTDVGLSSVTTYAAPNLVIILQHPIVKLSRTGEIYEVPMKDFYQLYMDLQGGDMVKLMDDLYKKLASSDLYKFYPLPAMEASDKVKQFRTNLAQELPGKYLKQEKGGLFLFSKAGEAQRLLKVSLARLMQPMAGCVSTWYVMINKVCPLCTMHIRPTYDKDQLILEPLEPWHESIVHKLDEKLIESIDLVAKDPDPVCGVSFSRKYPGNVTFDDSTLSWHYTDQNGTLTKVEPYSFYIPKKEDPNSRKYGRIVALGSNVVISGVKQYNGSVATDKNMARSYFSPITRTKMEDTHAKTQFQILYRKNCRSSVTTSIMFKDSKGRMIYPGELMTITAENKDVFTGYLSRMTVSGSTSGGCITKYELNYSRAANDDSLLIDGDQQNECFT